MKTLTYILAGIMLIIITSLSNSQTLVKNEQVITLQCITKNASAKLLSESKEILIRRLTYMNLRDVKISRNDAKSELVITVSDTINRETLLDLLLIRGHFNIYETMNRQEVLKYLAKHSSGCIRDAFKLMHPEDSIYLRSEPVLGIARENDTISINACFSSKEVIALLPKQLRLLWTYYPDDNKQYFLYCISSSDKTFNEQNIIEAHPDFANPEHPALCITFKEKVWKLWDKATIRNMNKHIAFVIDNRVYFAPRILGEIPGGKISLTGGGISKSEVRKLVAIISNGAVPLKFIVVSNN